MDYWDYELYESAGDGDLESIKKCLANGAYMNAKSKYGETALVWASKYGHFEIVKILVENGADVNAKDYYGGPTTVLICASKYGHFEIVKILVENGAEFDGNELCEKMTSYSDEVCKYLITLKEVQNAFVSIALNYHLGNCIKIASKCLKCGIDANVASDNGETAIMFACQKGYLDLVLILIAGKANINAKDKNGKTAINYSAESGNVELMKLLLAQGADTGARG